MMATANLSQRRRLVCLGTVAQTLFQRLARRPKKRGPPFFSGYAVFKPDGDKTLYTSSGNPT